MKRTDDLTLAHQLFDQCLFATLSLSEPDGTPYGVPISPVLSGECLYFHCAVKGRKLDAMRANPKVCLTCVGNAAVRPGAFDIDYQSAVAFGTVCEVTDRAEKIEALILISEKYCPDDMWDFTRVLEQYMPHTGVWKITPDTITTKG